MANSTTVNSGYMWISSGGVANETVLSGYSATMSIDGGGVAKTAERIAFPFYDNGDVLGDAVFTVFTVLSVLAGRAVFAIRTVLAVFADKREKPFFFASRKAVFDGNFVSRESVFACGQTDTADKRSREQAEGEQK